VSFAWDANNVWRSGAAGATPASATADQRLNHGYIDSTGGTNEATFASIFANNANKPLVYASNLGAFLAAQNAPSYSVVLYVEGDKTSARRTSPRTTAATTSSNRPATSATISSSAG
jgi:hypothetical protein